MPREIKDTKQFLEICQRKDARYLKVLKPSKNAGKKAPTKLKVRCSKFLYTFKVADKKKADRILKATQGNVKRIAITSKNNAGGRKAGGGAAAAGKKKAKN